jgi:hypothetical protein
MVLSRTQHSRECVLGIPRSKQPVSIHKLFTVLAGYAVGRRLVAEEHVDNTHTPCLS